MNPDLPSWEDQPDFFPSVPVKAGALFHTRISPVKIDSSHRSSGTNEVILLGFFPG
jgi:hypothetical protein